jgi:PAS domain-containing protein
MLNLLAALENTQQGVVLLDADLQVLVFNTQAAELLRAPKGAIEARYQRGENGRYTNRFR